MSKNKHKHESKKQLKKSQGGKSQDEEIIVTHREGRTFTDYTAGNGQSNKNKHKN